MSMAYLDGIAEVYCINCGRACGKTPRGFTAKQGFVCMGCEGATKEIFTLSLDGSNKLMMETMDDVLEYIKAELKDCDVDSKYIITKEEMRALDFHNLDEHTGF